MFFIMNVSSSTFQLVILVPVKPWENELNIYFKTDNRSHKNLVMVKKSGILLSFRSLLSAHHTLWLLITNILKLLAYVSTYLTFFELWNVRNMHGWTDKNKKSSFVKSIMLISDSQQWAEKAVYHYHVIMHESTKNG